MDASFRLARTRADGERLIELTAATPAAAVPACPDWTALDLLTHTSRVWHMLALFAEHQPAGFPDRELFPPKPESGGEVDAARVALDHVEAAMRALDPGTPMWSWGTTQASDFFHRRVHLETLVHRVDAEQAAGEPSVVGGDEGADGVDERFTEFVASREGRPSGSFHVHRTDGEGEWTLKVVGDTIEVTRDHAKGDAALKGPGGALLLALWGRTGIDDLEVFGDAAIIEEWFEQSR